MPVGRDEGQFAIRDPRGSGRVRAKRQRENRRHRKPPNALAATVGARRGEPVSERLRRRRAATNGAIAHVRTRHRWPETATPSSGAVARARSGRLGPAPAEGAEIRGSKVTPPASRSLWGSELPAGSYLSSDKARRLHQRRQAGRRAEKERHRTEVNDEILPEDAGGAAPQQQPGEFHQGPPYAQATSFGAIPGRDRHVLEHGPNSSKGHEHRAFEEEPWMQILESQDRGEGGAVYRGVAIRRIEDPPLSARRLDEEREPRVAGGPDQPSASERGGGCSGTDYPWCSRRGRKPADREDPAGRWDPSDRQRPS